MTEKSSSGRKLDGNTIRPWLLMTNGCMGELQSRGGRSEGCGGSAGAARRGGAGRACVVEPHKEVGRLPPGEHALDDPDEPVPVGDGLPFVSKPGVSGSRSKGSRPGRGAVRRA